MITAYIVGLCLAALWIARTLYRDGHGGCAADAMESLLAHHRSAVRRGADRAVQELETQKGRANWPALYALTIRDLLGLRDLGLARGLQRLGQRHVHVVRVHVARLHAVREL